MGRPFWSGNISFGLVQIPVGVQSAGESGDGLSLSLIDKKDSAPVGYKYVNKSTGEEVPRERRVKGYEVRKGDYVILSEADFKTANVKKSETIDIVSFVDPAEIPMTRFEKPYWLSPSKKGLKPYALLRDALEQTGKVALATVVLRQRQSLCIIVPQGKALLLEMLRYDDELRAPEDAGIDETALDAVSVTKAEAEMARKLVEGMAQPFNTEEIRDTYKDDLMALIEARRDDPQHVPDVAPKTAEKRGQVVDIMALLKRSVEQRNGNATNDDESAAERSAKPEKAPAPKKSTKPAKATSSRRKSETPRRATPRRAASA